MPRVPAPSGAPKATDQEARPASRRAAPCYAALDLGTNNCRLLIATRGPKGEGFRVIEAFSRIVRLGDGLSRTGRLDDQAMERAVGALRICADKIRRRRPVKLKAVATQACRSAENGTDFIHKVEQETGLKLQIISPREEAQLSVAGCAALLDPNADAALVVDVGGGSTELSWVDLKASPATDRPTIRAWLSIPVGVVTLAERFPEAVDRPAWFLAMVEHVRGHIAGFSHAEPLRDLFSGGQAHLIGTSGAITSLAGMHLGLSRYERARVDGLWLTRSDCDAAAARLMALNPAERAAQPCIGAERADLVLAGAAILDAVQSLWPCARVRVADRGLREGLLISLMNERRRGRRRRRGGQGERRAASPAAAGAAAS